LLQDVEGCHHHFVEGRNSTIVELQTGTFLVSCSGSQTFKISNEERLARIPDAAFIKRRDGKSVLDPKPEPVPIQNPYTEPEPMQEPEGKVPIFEIEAEFVAWLAANPPERSASQSRPLKPRYVQEFDPPDCALPIEQSYLAIPGRDAQSWRRDNPADNDPFDVTRG
jgi:hypothetical protein